MSTLSKQVDQIPQIGMFATVRNRRGIVSAVEPFDCDEGRIHLVHIEYKDDQYPLEESLLWELEPRKTLVEPTALPDFASSDPMPHDDFDALPEGAKHGETIHGEAIITDETLVEPFLNQFILHVTGPKESTGGGNGTTPPKGKGKGDRLDLDHLQLPQVIEVREDRWEEFGFDKFGALRVFFTGDDGYDFHLNMDNVFLRTELKAKAHTDEAKLVEAQFKYAMVLMGLAVLKDREILDGKEGETESSMSVEAVIFQLTRSISPVVIPMINALGGLQIEDIAMRENGQFEFEE